MNTVLVTGEVLDSSTSSVSVLVSPFDQDDPAPDAWLHLALAQPLLYTKLEVTPEAST